MDKCFRCGKTPDQVRLFDGLYGMENARVCERCALISNIPLIKGPNIDQLRNSEKPDTVRNRLSRLAGIKTNEPKEKTIYEEIKKLDEHPELEKPEDIALKLVDNFHWRILTERRRKGLSLKQLAEAIQDSESALKLIERGELSSGSLELIKKLEFYFKLKFIKDDPSNREDYLKRMTERRAKAKLPPPFDPHEEALSKPSMPERAHIEEMKHQEAEEMVQTAIREEKNPVALGKESVKGTPLKLVDFKRHSNEELSIADLKRLQERVTKDFTKKTAFELGPEQTEAMMGGNVDYLRKTVYRTQASAKSSNAVPSIYELAKKKEEQKKLLVGNEIDIVQEDKEKPV
jgi:ribosome-binding protein aMBF1 (putative translation factor)